MTLQLITRAGLAAGFVFLALAVSLAVPAAAHAQSSGWDQETVNELVASLDEDSMRALIDRLIERIGELGGDATLFQSHGNPTVEGAEVAINSIVQPIERLRVRAEASASSEIIGTVEPGDTAVVVAGPREADGYTWWRLEYDTGLTGWSAEDWLRVVRAAANPDDSDTDNEDGDGNEENEDAYDDEWFISSDIESVEAEDVDPIPNAIDDEYTVYTITLKNGEVIEVQGCGFCTQEMFAQAFYDAGYLGKVSRILAMVEDTGDDKDEDEDEDQDEDEDEDQDEDEDEDEVREGDWLVWDVETVFMRELDLQGHLLGKILFADIYEENDLDEEETYEYYKIYFEDGEYPSGIEQKEWPVEAIAEPDVEIFACDSCSDEEFYEAFYEAGMGGTDADIEYLKDLAEPAPELDCTLGKINSLPNGNGCFGSGGDGTGPDR